MRKLRLLRAMVGVAVGLVVLARCASEDLAKSEAKRDFADMTQGALDDAEAGGAGDEQLAIADACSTDLELWVRMAYVMPPTSIAVKDAYLDRQVPLVKTCLDREGYAAGPEASTHEVLRQALHVKTDTASAVDCLAEAKIDGF